MTFGWFAISAKITKKHSIFQLTVFSGWLKAGENTWKLGTYVHMSTFSQRELMSPSKISFQFKKTPTAAPLGKRERAPLAGFFSTVADADDACRADEAQEELQRRSKRLTLEDAHAKAARLQHEGCTLAEAGRYRAAMARWSEAIELEPQRAALYELLAQASMALGEDFRAIQFALRATQLAPTWGDGFLTLARSHLNFGELELAGKHMDTALALLGASDELVAEQHETQQLIAKQREVIAQREAQEALERDADKRQVLSCVKHLFLRGQTKVDETPLLGK